MKKFIPLLALFVGSLAAAAPSFQDIMDQKTLIPSFSTQVIGLGMLSLAPFMIMLFSSYIKTSIVLSLLRNSIGVQQAPPNQVINGISIIVAIYVMYPTLMSMYAASSHITSPPPGITSPEGSLYVLVVADAVKEPLRDFLKKNTAPTHLNVFHEMAKTSFLNDEIDKYNFIILMPSFIMTQIRDSFVMGTLIAIPFFVVDMVVSILLLALGMMMMSPMTIALPLKLALIVITNGWDAIIINIIKTFK